MAKTYWIGTYRAITNPDKLAAYAQLGGPAITAGGGRFIVRSMPAKTYEPKSGSWGFQWPTSREEFQPVAVINQVAGVVVAEVDARAESVAAPR